MITLPTRRQVATSLVALLLLSVSASAQTSSVTIDYPNGREQLTPGDSVTIEWSGVEPGEPVRLSYSTDAGTTWTPISGRATGLRHRWLVPATPTGDALVRAELWEPRTIDSIVAYPRHTGFISGGSFNRDASRLATVVRRPGHPTNSDVYVFDAATREQLRQITLRGRDIAVVEWAPDGASLLIAGTVNNAGDTSARIVDAASGAVRQVFRGQTTHVSSGAFAPDGLTAATGGFDLTVRIWEVATGQQLARLDSFRASPGALAFSPDGSILATAGGVGEGVQLWATATWQPVRAMRGDSLGRSYGAIRELSFSPDGTRLLGATEAFGGVMWDVATGATIGSFVQRRGELLRASFSPGGRFVGGGRDSVTLWNATTGERLQHFQAVRYPLGLFDFTADGAAVIVGGRDSVPRVFHFGGPSVDEDISDRSFGIGMPAGVAEAGGTFVARVSGSRERLGVSIDLTAAASVSIDVVDLLGRQIARDVRMLTAGSHRLELPLPGATGPHAVVIHAGRNRIATLVSLPR